ncbi:hypothetical protein Vretifemale_20594 [Volvox reticuliferus]|uniref:BCNT-C domain-containing protein n=1 Tax=Volvox reticuliferus TaxID=1737510 RepID=A0A8J4FXH4_9CHLO|nr:hypothetical protein Vretifemale_20594 [Volvox reticuliferus]
MHCTAWASAPRSRLDLHSAPVLSSRILLRCMIGRVLPLLRPARQVSVLDKTKADWSEYKAANTEVDEELETYKRSGEQYLDKQNFLKRAELREYEKERDLRLASDVRTRGRL